MSVFKPKISVEKLWKVEVDHMCLYLRIEGSLEICIVAPGTMLHAPGLVRTCTKTMLDYSMEYKKRQFCYTWILLSIKSDDVLGDNNIYSYQDSGTWNMRLVKHT